MKCENPLTLRPGTPEMMEVPCNSCLPCRLRAKEEWLGRIVMESRLHDQSVFVTLTYNEENCPVNENGQTLVKKHMTDFIKRLRYRVEQKHGLKFRFYAVGEYGSKTQRPHYHLVIFGLGVEFHQEIENSWEFGFSQVGQFTSGAGRYVAGPRQSPVRARAIPRRLCHRRVCDPVDAA